VTDACPCGCPDTQYRGTLCKHQLAAVIAREAAALLAQEDACIPAPPVLPQAVSAVPWTSQHAPATCFVELQAGPLRLSYTFRGVSDADVLTRLRAQLPRLQALLAASDSPVQALEADTPPAQPEPPPALTPEAVQALVQQAVRQALAGQAQSPAAPPSPAPANGQDTVTPAPQPSAPAQPEGWCPIHQVAMRQRHNAQGAWWSHRLTDGRYCKGESA
jgi:hypothetical protein